MVVSRQKWVPLFSDAYRCLQMRGRQPRKIVIELFSRGRKAGYDRPMSGQAGASIEGELYALSVTSGLSVDVAIPPDDDGSAVGRYFERESAPYRRWLARAQPAVTTLFAQLVAEGEPIVPRAQPSQTMHAVFVENESEAQFRKHYRGGPLAVHLDGALPGDRSLQLQFLVSRRVERRRMERVVERVAEILTTHLEPFALDEPVAPDGDEPWEPTPPPPPARPGWWRRLRGR
jgi:hypothetical protein